MYFFLHVYIVVIAFSLVAIFLEVVVVFWLDYLDKRMWFS